MLPSSPFTSGKSDAPKRWGRCHLPKVKPLVSGEVGPWTQATQCRPYFLNYSALLTLWLRVKVEASTGQVGGCRFRWEKADQASWRVRTWTVTWGENRSSPGDKVQTLFQAGEGHVQSYWGMIQFGMDLKRPVIPQGWSIGDKGNEFGDRGRGQILKGLLCLAKEFGMSGRPVFP